MSARARHLPWFHDVSLEQRIVWLFGGELCKHGVAVGYVVGSPAPVRELDLSWHRQGICLRCSFERVRWVPLWSWAPIA